jgi:predicted lipid-binding transport protein (Tim44 family)
MNRYTQFRYKPMPGPGQASPVARVLAAIVGILVLGVAIFLGAIFIAAILGLALLGGIIFAIRVWWLKRKMAQYQADHGDLEAEYTVIQPDPPKLDRNDS